MNVGKLVDGIRAVFPDADITLQSAADMRSMFCPQHAAVCVRVHNNMLGYNVAIYPNETTEHLTHRIVHELSRALVSQVFKQ